MVGVRRFELLTSSVSGKRSPPELNARISAAGVAARSILRENAHVTQPSIASFSRITNTAQREGARGRPLATGGAPAATNKALPAPPKPNLRVNSSVPRRTKPSTCGSSRHGHPKGAIDPQVSFRRRDGKSRGWELKARQAQDTKPLPGAKMTPERGFRTLCRRKRASGRHPAAGWPRTGRPPSSGRPHRHPVFCSPAATPDTVHRMR